MCVGSDPVTAAIMAVQAVGQIRGARHEASAMRAQGSAEYSAALANEEAMRGESEREAARQRLEGLSSGVGVGGTNATLIDRDAQRRELDALIVRYGGKVARNTANAQAKATERSGYSRAAGIVAAGAADMLLKSRRDAPAPIEYRQPKRRSG